jgi:hypothetical protein
LTPADRSWVFNLAQNIDMVGFLGTTGPRVHRETIDWTADPEKGSPRICRDILMMREQADLFPANPAIPGFGRS